MFTAEELDKIDSLTPAQILEGIHKRYPKLTESQEAQRLEMGLTVPQAIIYFSPEKYTYRVVMAGRRFGKTVLSLFELLRAAQVEPNSRCAYLGPQLKQAKRIFWRMLLDSIPKEMIAYKNETALELRLKGYNSTIQLFGADGENAEAMRGIALDFVVMDECKDIADHVFPEIVEPTLADSRRGDVLFIGTPSDGGTWFEDMFADGESGEYDYIKSYRFSTIEGGNVPLEKVKRAARRLGKEQWEREYNASIMQVADAVYSNFDRYKNVSDVAQDNGTELLVGLDFNVNPMCAVIGVDAGAGTLHVFDEVEIYGSTTAAVVEEIERRYPNRKLIFYPDPSGRQRRTATDATDFYVLQHDSKGRTRNHVRIIAPLKAPPIRDRINSVQALLANAVGERKLFVHPKCRSLITCLAKQRYDPHSSGLHKKPDKKGGYDHMNDALGYLVSQEYPIIKRKLGMRPLRGT